MFILNEFKFFSILVFKINKHIIFMFIFMYVAIITFLIIVSERWVVCLCNEPMAVQSARHDSRLKFLPIT